MEDDPTHPTQPYRFSSSSISIGCGGHVTITNNSQADHTFSPTQGGFADTGDMPAGAKASVSFRYRGSYGFYCAYHPWMTGKVTVT